MFIYFTFFFKFYSMQRRTFEIVVKDIGITMLLYRLRSGFSQFTLGIEVQMSTNQIGRIERGKTNPTVGSLTKIADALKIEISEFFVKRTDEDLNRMLDEIKLLQEESEQEKG